MTAATTNTNKRPLSGIESDQETIFISSPIQDRSSTFIAHFHPGDPSNLSSPQPSSSSSPSAAKPVSLTQSIKTVQNHPSFTSADHRIVAWRRKSSQRTLSANVTYTTGSDDDGEKYAGKRLERVLIDLDVQGSLVVARWYGGVLLGPVRFTHIENVAKEAIMKWKRTMVGGISQSNAGDPKRQKLSGANASEVVTSSTQVDDEAARMRLAKQLTERDKSILVLRDLLAEKTRGPAKEVQPPTTAESSTAQPVIDGTGAPPSSYASVSSTTPPPSTTSSIPALTSPAKQIDYTTMPLARLRQLDKARDATIAFILKQIDKAEEAAASSLAKTATLEQINATTSADLDSTDPVRKDRSQADGD